MSLPPTLRLIWNYERRVIRRAASDSAHFFGIKGLGLYLAAAIFGFATVGLVRGIDSMMDEIGVWTLTAVCPAIFVLLWYWLSAPARMDQEQEARLSSAGVGHPHYVAWDSINDLELRQAACLWFGIAPAKDIPSGKPQVQLHKLKEAIVTGDLKARKPDMLEIQLQFTPVDFDLIPDSLRVSRNALIEYATHINDKPEFLFPEQR